VRDERRVAVGDGLHGRRRLGIDGGARERVPVLEQQVTVLDADQREVALIEPRPRRAVTSEHDVADVEGAEEGPAAVGRTGLYRRDDCMEILLGRRSPSLEEIGEHVAASAGDEVPGVGARRARARALPRVARPQHAELARLARLCLQQRPDLRDVLGVVPARSPARLPFAVPQSGA
jgi:hypothetical protein